MVDTPTDIVSDKLMYPTGGLLTRDDVDTRMLYKEFQESIEQIYNDAEWGLLERFVRRTTKESVRVWQRNMEFVTAAEGYLETWQKMRAMEIPLNLEDFELGFAFTKKAIQDETADEIRETHSEALRADLRLMYKRFFYTALTPGSGTTTKGWWDGNMGAASKPGPPPWKGSTFTNTHNHYDVSGSADLALADFTALKREIREHGYGGELFCFLNTAQVEECENLAGWTSVLTPNPILDVIAREGFEPVKQFSGFTILIDDFVPDNYLLAIEARVKPITMREAPNAIARGLKLWEGPHTNYPLAEAYYSHRFDLAVVHRGAGAVRELTAAAYTAPTFTF